MQKKSLEISCYVAGGGAFGVFLRWLQDQIAFNELGLVDKSIFNVLVPLFIAAAAWVFNRFLRQDEADLYSVSEDPGEALYNEGLPFQVARIAAGALMCLGAVMLFAESEVDKQVTALRVLALAAVLAGVAYPLLLAEANRDKPRVNRMCVLAFAPILLFSVWLVVCYKSNAINSVPWSYGLDIFTCIMGMLAFFRLAGFAFGSPNGRRCRFDAMFTAVLCLMCLADERYTGMQLMLLSAALMLILYNWILVMNMRKGKAKPVVKTKDGFEHL